MSGWDWTFVGEVFVSVAGGISVGAWIAIGFARGLAYEMLSNSTVQKFAKGAEKISGVIEGKDGAGGLVGLAVGIGKKLGIVN